MKQINIDSWHRREIYEMFSKVDYPFYSVTIPVDVTNVKQVSKREGVSFYFLMIWLCTKAVNAIPEFKMRIREDHIYQLDQTEPSFTVMKKDEEHFIIVTTPWEQKWQDFCNKAESKSLQQVSLFGEHPYTDELIYFSCTPWFDFTALTNERNFDKNDTIPRIAWGKYYDEKERLMLHLSLDVNHRTIDGLHIGKFKDILDKEIKSL